MFFRKFFVGVLLVVGFGSVVDAKGLNCTERFAPIAMGDIVTFVPYVTDECRRASILEKIEKYALFGTKVASPSVQDFKDLGISSVTSYNLSTINSLIAKGSPNDVDSLAKIKSLVRNVISKHYLVGKFDGVKGVSYKTSSGLNGVTGEDGSYKYNSGDDVSFYIENLKLGTLKAEKKIKPIDLKNPLTVLQLLYAHDADQDRSTGFEINNSNIFKRSRGIKYKSNKESSIDVSVLSSGDEVYKNYVKKYLNGIILSKQSVLRSEIFNEIRNDIKNAPVGQSRFEGVLAGSIDPRFGDVPSKSDQLYYSNSSKKQVAYRMQLMAVKSLRQAHYRGLSDISEEATEEVEELKKDIDNAMKVIKGLYHVASSISKNVEYKNSMNTILDDVGMSVVKDMSNAFIVDEVQGGSTAKIVTDLATNGLINCAIKKDAHDCGIDGSKTLVKGLIISVLEDSHPEWSYFLSKLSDTTITSVDNYLTCSEKGKVACAVDISEQLYTEIMNLGSSLYLTYKLTKKMSDFNAALAGFEVLRVMYYLNETTPLSRGVYNYFETPGYTDKYKNDSADKQWDRLCKAVKVSSKIKNFHKFAYMNFIDCKKFKDYFIKDNLKVSSMAVSLNTYAQKYLTKMDDGTLELDKFKQLYIDKNVVMNIKNLDIESIKSKQDIFFNLEIDSTRRLKVENISIKCTKNGYDIYSDTELKDIHISPNSLLNIPLDFTTSNIDESGTFSIEVNMNFKYKTVNGFSSMQTRNAIIVFKTNIQNSPEPKLNITSTCKDNKCFISTNVENIDTNKIEMINYILLSQRDIEGNYNFETTSLKSKIAILKYDKANSLYLNLLVQVRYLDKYNNLKSKSTTHTLNLYNEEPIVVRNTHYRFQNNEIIREMYPQYSPKKDSVITIDSPSTSGVKIINRENTFIKVKATHNNDFTEKGYVKFQVCHANNCKNGKMTYSVKPKVSNRVDFMEYLETYPSTSNYYYPLSDGQNIVKKWGIKNISDKTLRNVTMIWDDTSTTTLTHSKGNISLGNIAVGEIGTPSISISKTTNNTKDQGKWYLYALDNNNKLQPLYYNSSTKAYLSYEFSSQKKVDDTPPVFSSFNLDNKDQKVKGNFYVYQKSNKIKNLKVQCSKDSSFSQINLESNYGSLETSGVKTFAFTQYDWLKGKVLYCRILGQNLLGNEAQSSIRRIVVEGGNIDDKPTIRITTSGSSSSNNPKTSNFTLSVSATDDKGLAGIAYGVYKISGGSAVKEGSKKLSGTSGSASFAIDVNSLPYGNYRIKVASVDIKKQVSSYVYYYFQKKLPVVDKKPIVTSVSPLSATRGKNTVFTVHGSNLPSTIAMSLYGSVSCGSPYSTTSTSAKISCKPNTLNSVRFYVKDKPGSQGGKPIDGSASLYVTVKNLVAIPIKPVISSLSLQEGTGGLKNRGYIIAKTNVSQSGSATIAALGIRCAINGNYTSVGAYKTKDVTTPATGSHTISISNSAWIGKNVECKVEATNSDGKQADIKKSTIQLSGSVAVDNKPSVSINTSGSGSNNPKTGNFTLNVSATDDKGLKEINYIIRKTSGGSVLKTGVKNISGTSANVSFVIDVVGLAVGSYKIDVEVIDTKDQASPYGYYYFQKKDTAPIEATKITNFNISQDKKGSGKVKIQFRVSSDVSLSRVRAYCSTSNSSSIKTSSSYYYHSKNTSTSSGSKTMYMDYSSWIDDTLYCQIEVVESNGKKTQSSIDYVFMYKATLVPPTVSLISLQEVGYGEGKLKVTYDVGASSSVSRVTVRCSRSSSVKRSSSYDYVSKEGSKSTGRGSVELFHSDWDGERVYCKVEVFAGTNKYSNIKSISLKKKTTYPTEAPRPSSPRDGERITKTNPRYTWFKADGASTYRIYIKSTDGTHTVATGRTIGNTIYINSSNFRVKSGKTYEWYVSACDANYKNCIPSDKRRFSVK